MDLKGKIVFSSGISVNFDIWCLDLESGSLLQLTHGDSVNDFPRWSQNNLLGSCIRGCRHPFDQGYRDRAI